MSSNTSEYEHAMLAFLLPALMHQLFPTQKDISDLLSRAELDIRRGPENTNEGILVRMVSLEANFNYLRLSVVPTTFVKKDVYDLMKKIYLSEYPIKFSEFDLYRDKEPSSNELLPLAFIAVGRCCRSLGYYVPKLLSENTVLSILSTLHAIMVDRRPRPGAAIGIPRQHQPPSWRPPPHCAPLDPGHGGPVPPLTCRGVQLTQEKLLYADTSDTDDSESDEDESHVSHCSRLIREVTIYGIAGAFGLEYGVIY